MEPDDNIRKKYFECQGECKPWVVPAHHNDPAAAKEIGYKLYRLDRCPLHTIWRGTRLLMNHPIFSAAIRYKKMSLVSGGILKQPVTMGHLVHFARHELDAFSTLLAHRRGLEKNARNNNQR